MRLLLPPLTIAEARAARAAAAWQWPRTLSHRLHRQAETVGHPPTRIDSQSPVPPHPPPTSDLPTLLDRAARAAAIERRPARLSAHCRGPARARGSPGLRADALRPVCDARRPRRGRTALQPSSLAPSRSRSQVCFKELEGGGPRRSGIGFVDRGLGC